MDKRLEKILGIIRSLKEEAPTMNVGAGQIAGTAEAGDDPPVRKKKRYIYPPQKGYRTLWKQK